MTTKLVRIPRHLLHLELGGLRQLGVPEPAQAALRELLADLPLVPQAADSALLQGRPEVTLPCLAVVARHVGQGLRGHNLSLAADRTRLRTERYKLVFLDAKTLENVLASGDERPIGEAALFVMGTNPSVLALLGERQANGLASFVTSTIPVVSLAHWRQVDLSG